MTKSRLVEKIFESMNQDERPRYFERLFGELSSEEQQAFLLFRKRYPTYCIPLVALDAVEKALVDRRTKNRQGGKS